MLGEFFASIALLQGSSPSTSLSALRSKIAPIWVIDRYKKLGKMKYEEYVVMVGFILLSLLWLFRVDLVFGDNVRIPGIFGIPQVRDRLE